MSVAPYDGGTYGATSAAVAARTEDDTERAGISHWRGRASAQRTPLMAPVGTPVAVFAVDGELLLRLEATFGPPLDSYLNGWQVWLEELTEDNLPEGVPEPVDEVTLEFRLHPPVGFEQPEGLSHHDLWDEVVVPLADARAEGEPFPDGFALGAETRRLEEVWTLLEVFPAYGEDVTPDLVRMWAQAWLGRMPVGVGRVDHATLGGRWKREGNRFDLAGAIRQSLGAGGIDGSP